MKLHLDSTRASAARKLLTAVLAVQMVALNFSSAWAAPAPAVDALPEFQPAYTGREISRADGVLKITAGGDIKYNSFNIGSEAAVHFVGGGTTVNKIYDANPSQIFGLLTADGKIYLLNANGILFGSTARVNVGGLVASTFMDVGNDEAGNLVFKGDPGDGDITVESGAVINAGAFAYLVGRNVNLGGAVNAGDVQVAAFGGEQEDIELTTANGGKILLKLGSNTNNATGGSISITNAFTNVDYSVVYTNESAQVLTNTVAVSNITLYAVSDISQIGTWEANAPVVALGAPSVKSSTNSSISATGNVYVGVKYVSSIASNAETGVVTTNFDWKPFGTTNISLAGNVTAGSNVWMTAGTTITLTNGTVEAVPGSIQLDGTVDAGKNLQLETLGAGAIAQGTNGAVKVGGQTLLDAADGTITLGNMANDFQGTVSASGASVTMADGNSIVLGPVKSGTAVFVDAVDGIALDGAMTAGGTVVLKAPSVTSTTNGAVSSADNVYVGGQFDAVINVDTNGESPVTTTNYVWNTFGTTNIALAGGVSASNDVRMSAGKIITTTNGDETVSGFIQLDGTVDAGKKLQLDTLGAGAIAQGTNGAPAVKVGGETILNAGNGSITLGSKNNDFVGAVTATGKDVTLTDKNSIKLGAVTATNLTVSAKGGSITQSAVAKVTGTAGLDATGNITLDNAANDFGGAVGAKGKEVTLTDKNSIQLGAIDASKLTVSAKGGTITQSAAAKVTGATGLDATGNITLDNAANDFGGTVSAKGKEVTLKDKNAIELGAVTATNLTVSVLGGNITQSAAVTVSSNTSLTATGNITLANEANDFTDAVSANGQNVTLKDKNSLLLGDVTAKKDLTATALNGSITQTTNGTVNVTGTTTLAAPAGDITLANAANNFGGTVKATATDGNITLKDKDSLKLDTVTAGTNVTATAVDALTVTGTVTAKNGVADLAAGNGATISGTVEAERAENAPAESQAGLVKVTASNGALKVSGTVQAATDAELKAENGTMDISGKVDATSNVTATASQAFTVASGGTVKAQTGDVEVNAASMEVAGNVAAVKGGVNGTASNGAVNVTGTVQAMTDATLKAENSTITVAAGGAVETTSGRAYLESKDAATLSGKVTSLEGDVAVKSTNGTVTVDGTATVKGGQNVSLIAETDKGDVIISTSTSTPVEAGKDLTVLAGNNLTVNSDAKLTAASNVVMKATNDVNLTKSTIHSTNVGIQAEKGDIRDDWATVEAEKTMILVAGQEVEIHSDLLVTDTLGVQAGDDITFDNLNVKNFAATSTGGNVTVNTVRDVNLAGGGKVEAVRADSTNGLAAKVEASGLNGIQAKKNVTMTAESLSVTGSQLAAGGDLDLKAGNVSVGSMNAGSRLDAKIAGSLNVSGTMNAGGEAKLDAGSVNAGTISSQGSDVTAEVRGPMTVGNLTAGRDVVLDSVGGDFTATTVSARNEANMKIHGGATVQELSAGSKLAAEIDGSGTLRKVNVGGSADVRTGGSLTFDQMKAGNVKLKSGTLNAGKLDASRADIEASSIHDNASLLRTGTLNMRAGGDIGSAGKPINLETRSNIERISGKNIYLVEQSSGHNVVLGTIDASGHLSLSAPRIGLPNGQYGFVDGNGNAVNLHAGSGLELDIAGFFGQPGNPMEAEVNGDWILRSGDLHGMSNGDPSTGTPLNLIYMVFGNTLYTVTPVYDGNGPIPGLVIVNGRPVQGHPDLLRKIHSALAFTADTPELKSTQGVFGNPLFLHTDLALTDMGALGLVDYLTFMNLTRRRPDAAPVWDAMVDDFTTLFEKWDIAGEGQFPSKDQKTPYNQPALLIMPATPSGGQAAKNPPAKPAEKPLPVQGAAPQDRVVPAAKGQPAK